MKASVSILSLLMMIGCVGRFETKPSLTAACRMDWKMQAGITKDALPDPNAGQGLQVLVFNIHDRLLPGSLFSKEAHTEEEVACIGDLASLFDLVLFQEAFVRPRQIARYTGHVWADYPLFTEGGGGDWWPLRMICKICLSPGLLMLARESPKKIYSEPFDHFAGWNTDLDKADDFFSKGFQLVKFPTLWVLNSHMDAGRGQQSIEARGLQFSQITEALKRLIPHDAPLFVGMDSNLRPDLEFQDAKILDQFLEENGLSLVRQSGPDLIAVRHIQTAQPRVLPLKGVLSDHHGLSVIVFPRPPSVISP